MTLKLQPLFKRSITRLEKNDSDLGDQVVSFGNQHEFADIYWYPSQRKAIYRIDDRVPLNTSGNGLYDYLGFRSVPSFVLAGLRTAGQSMFIYFYILTKFSQRSDHFLPYVYYRFCMIGC